MYHERYKSISFFQRAADFKAIAVLSILLLFFIKQEHFPLIVLSTSTQYRASSLEVVIISAVRKTNCKGIINSIWHSRTRSFGCSLSGLLPGKYSMLKIELHKPFWHNWAGIPIQPHILLPKSHQAFSLANKNYQLLHWQSGSDTNYRNLITLTGD